GFPSPDEAIDLVVEAVAELSRGVDPRRLWGVGVGFPGPLRIVDGAVDNVINPEGFPGWESVSVRALLSRRLSTPVFLENNATAAALGEGYHGVGAGLSSYFYVFLGVGLGGAIVVGGRAVRGWQGNAGELGYLPATPGAPGDHLGRRFDMFRLYERLAAAGVRASSYADLARLLAEGEPLVLAWLDALRSPLIPARAPLLTAALGADAVARGVATLPLRELLAPFPTSTEGAAPDRAHPYEHPLVAVR